MLKTPLSCFKLNHKIAFLLSITLLMSSNALWASGKEGKFFGAKPTEYPAWFKDSFLDFNEDVADAKEAGKRIVVFFHQAGCPYCNALVERNMAQKDIEDKIRKNFEVIAINMWGDREITYVDGKQYSEKTLAEALRVQFTPTLLFYNETGKVVLRLNGYRSPLRFSIDLDYVSQHQEGKTDYRNYVKTHFKPKLAASSKKLFKEDFFASNMTDLTRKPGSKSRPLAVFFEQTDCPNCERLHTKVLPDKSTRQLIKKFDNVQLNMWAKTKIITPDGKKTTVREWAKKLDIKYAPSIVLFNEKGKEIIRSEAFFKVFHTQSLFDYVLDGGYKKQPSFQRYLAARADHFREQGRDVDIWGLANQKAEERK